MSLNVEHCCYARHGCVTVCERQFGTAAFRQLLAARRRKLAVAGGGRRRSACPAAQLATHAAAFLLVDPSR